MRIDHLAYRVKDRHKTVEFFKKAFGYTVQTEFEIEFDDGSKAKCFALEPPEKVNPDVPWTYLGAMDIVTKLIPKFGAVPHIGYMAEFHMAPEIFVSDGSHDSVVGKWVAERNGVGGIHHVAYMVDSVKDKMAEWKEKGFAEFTTDEPMKCPGLTQVFTKPSELTGVIYEFIEREGHGFCKENVRALMTSTKGL